MLCHCYFVCLFHFVSFRLFKAVLFGISSWIGVSSSYLQVPLLVSTAPEGLALPSQMTVAVQSSNVISFAYIAYQKFSPVKVKDGHLITMTMLLGCATAVGMAFFYGQTAKINGNDHSVAYLVGVFLFATVGTVSAVLFLPYMGRFRECYLVSYMSGQGMNGLFSTFLALCQGIGDADHCVPNNSTDGPAFIKKMPTPNFGIQMFFLLVSSALVVCTIAFVLLNNLKICKKEYAPGRALISNEFYYNEEDRHDIVTGEVPENVLHLSKFNYRKLMLALFLIGFVGNGIFPGLMSYSSYPYGAQAYHLSVTLASVGNYCICLYFTNPNRIYVVIQFFYYRLETASEVWLHNSYHTLHSSFSTVCWVWLSLWVLTFSM